MSSSWSLSVRIHWATLDRLVFSERGSGRILLSGIADGSGFPMFVGESAVMVPGGVDA